MECIRYQLIEKVIDVPLLNARYPGFFLGGYKTNFATHVAEHAILYRPSLDKLGDAPLVRINSACFTGDIFGDERCDCNEQMFAAMEQMMTSPGLVIYHFHHEGRGLGFTSKLSTYQQMAQCGISTFTAMSRITNRIDLRTYGSAVLILKDLGIKRLRLLTNNPGKQAVLEQNGIEVTETVRLISKKASLQQYLESKRDEQGHRISLDAPHVIERAT